MRREKQRVEVPAWVHGFWSEVGQGLREAGIALSGKIKPQLCVGLVLRMRELGRDDPGFVVWVAKDGFRHYDSHEYETRLLINWLKDDLDDGWYWQDYLAYRHEQAQERPALALVK